MTDLQDAGAPVGRTPVSAEGRPSAVEIGQRLREAREATGLARDEFARRAHIPGAVLADLEAGRLDRLGAFVYVRGYLRSFARAAGQPESAFLGLLPPQDEAPPPLVAKRVAPATPRWVTRYATPVAYALLTAVVMVPLVYLARPATQPLAQAPSLTPIDAAARGGVLGGVPASPEILAQGLAAGAERGSGEPGRQPPALGSDASPVASPATSQAPVMASLAPLPQVAAPAGTRRVTLRLSADSWVEFTTSGGDRLEYALLPAGTVREYELRGSAMLMIGNSSAAQLTVDGRAVDLGPHRSGNDVARLRLGDGPEPASASD